MSRVERESHFTNADSVILTFYSYGFTFRKEGHTKIIEYDLSKKQKGLHDIQGLKRPKVLSRLAEIGPDNSPARKRRDSDASMEDESEEEPAGESTRSDGYASQEDVTSMPRAANGTVKTTRGRNERIVAPEECRAHLRLLFKNERVLCSLIYGRHGPLSPVNKAGLSIASADMFFMEVLLVPPTRFRPPAMLGDMVFEHPHNELLTRVINTSYRLRDLNNDLRLASSKSDDYSDETRRKVLGQLLESLVQLQVDINSFIDSNKNPQPVRQGKLPPAGIKQGLEKKDGLFRKHMMVHLC